MARTSALVVGGGVMGLAAGCALARRGVDVTVLERQTVGHDWASSHGLSRVIRHEYGAEAIYTRMVALSLPLWDELARETSTRLYTETGVLTLGQPDDGHTLPGYDVMRAEGLPIEQLTAAECRVRFPQFRPDEYAAITYNPTGGMLHASQCLRALAQRLKSSGGQLREDAHAARVEGDGPGGRVTLANGDTLRADRVIVTAGPWVHDVLPELRLPIRPTRQQVAYLSGLPEADFSVGKFPVFLVGMEYYGFPVHGPGLFKVGSHRFGATVDPNAGYPGDEDELAEVHDFLRQVIPAAAHGTLELVDRCMYDVSQDEDFILDQHPETPSVIIGSGFSGHGFKFGPLIGELLAALALDESPAVPLERFRLARFGA